MDADLPKYLPVKSPSASCGTCQACMDVCPTGAFTSAFELDARRCISYLTIEHRGSIPEKLRPLIGDWVFGCDLCMEVCPFGHRAEDHSQIWGTKPAFGENSLEDLLKMSKEEFHAVFAGSPIRRAGWAGMLRNCCVALGNLGQGKPLLRQTADSHPEPMVREHANWALERWKQPKK